MSVILRRNNRIILYCKGADNVIYDRLATNQVDIKTRTQEHLNVNERVSHLPPPKSPQTQSVILLSICRNSPAKGCVHWCWPNGTLTKSFSTHGGCDNRRRPHRLIRAKIDWAPSTRKSNAKWVWWAWRPSRINCRTVCNRPFLIYKWLASKSGYSPVINKVRMLCIHYTKFFPILYDVFRVFFVQKLPWTLATRATCWPTIWSMCSLSMVRRWTKLKSNWSNSKSLWKLSTHFIRQVSLARSETILKMLMGDSGLSGIHKREAANGTVVANGLAHSMSAGRFDAIKNPPPPAISVVTFRYHIRFRSTH